MELGLFLGKRLCPPVASECSEQEVAMEVLEPPHVVTWTQRADMRLGTLLHPCGGAVPLYLVIDTPRMVLVVAASSGGICSPDLFF